ncbi:chromosome segregation protein Spc25-domain-containing protein [Crepidotus variabilis]|uniref:Kinetochore protein SPC25 n=1 Tax=Crepidotus variabilis TaxID=179855 RepID=A0A9P6E544_9AGAR|nr:chromosome segregation protein Spc25-domain-containing protein [Crepidotus variabilis]
MSNVHVRRPLQINLQVLLQQQHPTIDIGLQSYENSTRNFLKAVSNYKNRAMATIAERRKHQAQEKKRIVDKTQAVENETGQCKLKEIELVAQLEREKEERKDAELSVAAFKRQLATLKDKATSVEADIEQYTTLVQNLRREKGKDRSTLSAHASHIPPEIINLEKRLSCTVEGVQADRLLIRYFQLDPTDAERDASFVLDISGQNFKVITASPHLQSMAILVNSLNESRDLYAFILNVRTAYTPLFDHSTR